MGAKVASAGHGRYGSSVSSCNPFLEAYTMQKTLLATLIVATILVACGKKEDVAAPAAEAPPAEAAAPVTAPEVAMPESPVDANPGKAKFSATCASCHGVNGEGMGTFPKVAGLDAAAAAAKLNDYRAGKQMGQQTAVMAGVAKGLSDGDISMLSEYIATLK
jgi:cytochrome c553